MNGYRGSIERLTRENADFRRVLYTGAHAQLVLMCLAPGEAIGQEVHADNDQFFRFEAGHGRVTIDGVAQGVADGDAAVVPAGARHNVENTSAEEPLKLYTLYSPPHHRRDVVRATKAEAEANPADFDGQVDG